MLLIFSELWCALCWLLSDWLWFLINLFTELPDYCHVFVQLFSAFDICGGCRKLTVSYGCDDDATGCLPLYAYKRRTSDGRISSRRCSNVALVRITMISVAAIMLFILIVFLGHPSTKVDSLLASLKKHLESRSHITHALFLFEPTIANYIQKLMCVNRDVCDCFRTMFGVQICIF